MPLHLATPYNNHKIPFLSFAEQRNIPYMISYPNQTYLLIQS